MKKKLKARRSTLTPTESVQYEQHGGEHQMGRHTGYELTADGSYYPAPTYTDQFDETRAERIGVQQVLTAISEDCSIRLARVNRRENRLIDQLVEDLCLDPAKDWVYHYNEKCLRVAKPKTGDGPQ